MSSHPFELALADLGYTLLEKLGKDSNEVYKARHSKDIVILKLGVPTQSSFAVFSNPWDFSIRQVATERKILRKVKEEALANILDYFELPYNAIGIDYSINPSARKIPIVVKQYIDGRTPTVWDELNYSLNYPRIEKVMKRIHEFDYAFLELYRKNLILNRELLFVVDVGLCKSRKLLKNDFDNYVEKDKENLEDLFKPQLPYLQSYSSSVL